MNPQLAPMPFSGAAARLDAMIPGRWHGRMRAAIGFTILFDGFDALMLSLALPAIAPQWNLSAEAIGAIISATFIGQAVGAIFFGQVAERFGRLPAIRASIIVFSLASLASAAAGNYGQLVLFRFIGGIGLGGEIPVASTYVTEFAPARSRGRFFMLFLMAFSVGQLIASLAGAALIPRLGWRVLMVLGAAPLLLLPILGKYCPESPRWLASKGRLAEADAIIDKIGGGTLPLSAFGTGSAMVANPEAAAPSGLLGSLFRRRTLTIWSVWFLVYAVAYGLQGWLPTLYKVAYGLTVQGALNLTIGGTLVIFGANLICAFTLDLVERRTWFCAALGLSTILLSISVLYGAKTMTGLVLTLWPAMGAIATVTTSLYLYTAEIYPTALRTQGIAWANFWLRSSAIVAPMLVALAVRHAGLAGAFGFGAVCSGLALIACLVGGIAQSRGRPLDALEEASPGEAV